ncbi:MAG: FAD-dependent oxidoreductase [Chloroflexi bacterium]|nr:FAD-dependent oxidoreductase [Chloroflexota bacterium]
MIEPLALISEQSGQRFVLPDGRWVVGRDPRNPVYVDDEQVARQHARITVVQGQASIVDLRSASGTFVNGSRVTDDPAPFGPGDVVTFGAVTFQCSGPPRHEILILGGGFAGVHTALELMKKLKKRSDVRVSLVSQDNFFLFQPMLAEIISGEIETSHILTPIRRLCPGVAFYNGTIEAIDVPSRQVTVRTGRENQLVRLRFDHLVLALGSVTDLSRNPGMTEHALLAKTLGDAFHLRNHVLDMLEKAEAESDPDERRRQLTFVVAGAGFSGVEVIAELADFIHDALRYYAARREEINLILVQSPKRILPEVSERLAVFAQKELEKKSIEVVLGTRIHALTPDEAIMTDGRRIQTRTLIATMGNVPNPLLATLPLERDRRGAAVTNEYLETSVPAIYALGDNAAVPDLKHGGACPPTAQYALRQGKTAARNILADLNGGKKVPFVFGGLGQLASLGRGSAVAELMGGVKLSGFIAWSLWRFVYLSKLPTFERRLHVAVDWTLHAFLPPDTVRLQVERSQQFSRQHYEPGQVIVKQGDVGTQFYLVAKGEVEVVREGAAGEERLATLGSGQYFGELALLGSIRRTASVRAITPVDVLAIERSDFLALTTHGSLKLDATWTRMARLSLHPDQPGSDGHAAAPESAGGLPPAASAPPATSPAPSPSGTAPSASA